MKLFRQNRTREESCRLLVLKFWISSCMRTERKVLFRGVLNVPTSRIRTRTWEFGRNITVLLDLNTKDWTCYSLQNIWCLHVALFCFCIPVCSRVQMSLVHRGLHNRTWTGSPVESRKWAAVTGCVVFQTSSQLPSWENHDFCHLQFSFLQLFHNKSQFVFHQLNTFNEKQQLEMFACAFVAYKNSSDSTFGVLESHVGMADPATSNRNHNIKEKFSQNWKFSRSTDLLSC